jgi:hypothetical protein
MVFLGAKNPVTMQLLILTIWPHFYHLIFLLFQIPQTILLWDISPVILKMVTGLSGADPEFVVRGA